MTNRIVISKAFLSGMLTSGAMFGLYYLATISSETSGPLSAVCDYQGQQTAGKVMGQLRQTGQSGQAGQSAHVALEGQTGTTGPARQSGQQKEGQEMVNPVVGEYNKLRPAGKVTDRSPAGKDKTHQTVKGTSQDVKPRKKSPDEEHERISLDSIQCPQDKQSGKTVVVPGLDCRKRLPQAIGIGFAKCGTDALLFFLSSHPAFMHSEEMEIYYWTEHWKKGLSWYQEQMPVTSQYQVTMEKTPAYVLEPEVPERIKASMPNTKFILMVREPVARAISDFIQMQIIAKPEYDWFKPRPLPPGQESLWYLNTTFEGSVIKPNGKIFSENSLLAHSVYVHYVKKWLRVFPREQFLIIDTDEFTKNPLPILYEAERFLGLPKYFNEKSVYYDEKKGFYCRTRNIGNRTCLGGAKGRPHPTVDDDVISKLKAYFRPFNKQFEQLVGKTFSWS